MTSHKEDTKSSGESNPLWPGTLLCPRFCPVLLVDAIFLSLTFNSMLGNQNCDFFKSCNFYNMESYCNTETIQDSLPPLHWRLTGLERQNSGSFLDILGRWGRKAMRSGRTGGGRYAGERKWILSSCPIVWPCQERWPCSHPWIMKGWLNMQFSISLQSPHNKHNELERGACSHPSQSSQLTLLDHRGK